MNSNSETRNANRNSGRERTPGTQNFSLSASAPSPIGWERVAAGRVRAQQSRAGVRCDSFSASDGEKVAEGRMRCPALSLLALLLSALFLLHSAFTLSAATFTTNLTLSETNTAYDGQDIVISGATVAIDGAHGFNSLLLTNGAVLTYSGPALKLTCSQA